MDSTAQRFMPRIDALLGDFGIDRVIREQLARLVAEEVERERERCVRTCRQRAEKWRTTTSSQSSIQTARDEARSRANEASYLADLLETGEDLTAESAR